MIETQPLEVSDFRGGMTDNYVDAELDQYERADNLLLTTNGKLLSRQGMGILDVVNYQIPAGAQRIGALASYDNDRILLVQSARNVYHKGTDIFVDAYTAITGPAGNPALGAGTTASLFTHATWNKILFCTNDSFTPVMRVHEDGAGDMVVMNAGLPPLATAPSVVAGAVGVNNYLYRFVHYYTYTVDSDDMVEYQDFGPVVEVALFAAAAPDISNVNISAIPVLANGSTENWDTTAIKILIYRTTNNGTTFYKLGEVTNGTTVFVDSTSDATLIDAELLYTEGGVVDNDPPPLCKYLHIVNGICYFAHVQEDGQTLTNRVRQSIQNDPDSAPLDFFIDLEDEITGISSAQGTPVVLCKRFIYRLDGLFDELGSGGISQTKINDTVGCVSHQGIVQTTEGIFFPGNDGFYFCDGYKVTKITEELNERYAKITTSEEQRKRIYGYYDKRNNRIYWSVQAEEGDADVTQSWVLDLRWGIKPQSTFTTLSGGEDSYSPTSGIFFNDTHVFSDYRGYVFYNDILILTDPVVNILAAPSLWNRQTVIFDYTSFATNFGSNFIRKWVPRMNFLGKNETNLSAQVISINDDHRSEKDLSQIRFRGNLVWGDPDATWGDDSLIWNFDGIIEEQRRFPASGLRCSYKQIEVTNAFTTITNSDLNGTASVVVTIATLDNAIVANWPLLSVGYSIAFEADGYVKNYEIITRSDDTITFIDTGGTAPQGVGNKWIIRGYPKNEVLHMLGFVLHYGMLSKTQKMFKSADSGNNA